ncbi:MAG: hypothetical protein AAFY82_04300 [Pseudomonadota bacterium]
MNTSILFWSLAGGLAFAFALAVQMRVVTALVLRRALGAWREPLTDREKANAAVMAAAGTQPLPDAADPWLGEAVAHLQATYPSPLQHLRTARRYSLVTPVLLLIVFALGRLVWGVI